MNDYARDIELVRRAVAMAEVHGLVRAPAQLLAGALHPGLLRGVANVIGSSSESNGAFRLLNVVWSHRHGVRASRAANPLLRALWTASKVSIGTLYAFGCHYEYRVVFGVPIGMQPGNERGFAWMHCPVADSDVFGLARGHDWVFGCDDGQVTMTVDSDVEATAIMDTRTEALIRDIESIPGCRAHLLWGPPRAGKSVAAKQVARAVGGSWARVCGEVCTDAVVWRALDVLRPRALIIDDIDISVGAESALMHGLDQAREWARVIISTANVVPTADNADGRLRGAVIGRASDGALIEYRALSDEVRRAIAPSVPPDLDTHRLLAKHLAELQRRAVARGVTQADVDELVALQQLSGDR